MGRLYRAGRSCAQYRQEVLKLWRDCADAVFKGRVLGPNSRRSKPAAENSGEAIIEIAAVSSRALGLGYLTRTSPSAEARAGPRRAGFEAAAALLGTEATELTQRVRSGERLAEIAAEVHVGADELRVAMPDAVRETAPAVIAQRMVARLPQVIFGTHPLAGQVAPELGSAAIESLAARLEVRAEDLHASLEDGSFRQLLADNGVEARLGILVNLMM